MPVELVQAAAVLGGNGDLCLCVPAGRGRADGALPVGVMVADGRASLRRGAATDALAGLSAGTLGRLGAMSSVLLAEMADGRVARLRVVPVRRGLADGSCVAGGAS